MYPSIEIFWQLIFVFGVTIVICFFLFLWMLKKLSIRLSYDYNFLANSILWYFLSVFLFSRLFYIASMWNGRGNIENFYNFFITSDYNFSLFGALFGFMLVFIFNIKLFRHKISKYLDWIVLSFLFIAIPWFIGAFFGWQVYWDITNFGFEISYAHSNSFVPLHWSLFPLPLIYSLLSFILFSVLYILSMYLKTRWVIWYVWMGIFSAMVLWLEFFSWKPDIFKSMFNLNLSQISAIVFIFISFIWLIHISSFWKKQSNLIIPDTH